MSTAQVTPPAPHGDTSRPDLSLDPGHVTPPVQVPRGRVIFVGTGPGDPDLLTLGAVAAIAEADAVLLDSENLAAIFDHPAVSTAEGVRPVSIGTRENGKNLAPSARAKQVLKAAAGGGRVVRLVQGDPFLDGGVADEAAACVKGGIDFEVVPGVSALTAVPEYAGVALNNAAGTHFVSAMDGRITKSSSSQWAPTGTLVVSTRAGMVPDVAAAAIGCGRPPEDPVLITLGGGSTEQNSVVTTLAELPRAVAGADVDPELPVHVMVGPVVEHREDLSWYETKPLFGWRVLVPRTKDQAGPMTARLRSYGAHSDEVPTISVEPPRSPQQMDRAVRGLVEGRFEWVAFTSVNAVKAVREKFEQYGLDARAFSGLKVAAVGQVTAAALQSWGIEPDLVPTSEQSSAGLVAEFPPYDEVLDPINRVFLPRADIATETLSAGLTDLGWEVEDVTAYRTVRAAPPPAPIREAIKGGQFDAVVFTSSSTVRNLVGIAGKPHPNTVVAVIGPATARTCEEHGLRVDVMAAKPSVVALADALASFAATRRDEMLSRGEPVVKPSQQKAARRR
ncbi:bifunctional uroporphyrinogen-III C-methyltransferase/uroporphyrinogen-III synthase [Auraticoccus sp. F435]|uniref:uroporphyrinogen-III C-methyltransferase n=1 Tax=Auraticoccus cholistanensis TaxID=2656650 RepID=A0A6A9UYQ4_9ACTN|nr:uroporphyrinogen-III synthase [Auraticoccus cholistanensis]MVA77022.1 bifunctional uroporphyrinogen-III C-methyltransferase/uroporphyrinogen-III synthase [Auraticoccus cholistanensis]